MKITLETLTKLNACQPQVDLFLRLFPDGAAATKKNCIHAAINGMELDWLAARLFTPVQRAAYNKAVAQASQAQAQVSAAYDEAVAQAYKALAQASAAYNKAEAPALAAYEEAVARARAAYSEAVAPARAAYDEALTQARAAY